MVIIEFLHRGKPTKGILLGKYQCPHEEVYRVQKRCFWKTKAVYKSRLLHTPLYIVFVPWQHQEKEILAIDEKYVLRPQEHSSDEAWIQVDRFTAQTTGEYPQSIKVKCFIGYPFIYEHNSFIASLALHEKQDCLSVLYQHLPNILEMHLDNQEE